MGKTRSLNPGLKLPVLQEWKDTMTMKANVAGQRGPISITGIYSVAEPTLNTIWSNKGSWS